MRPDNSELLVNYDNFVAQAGPNVPPTEFRKNCQLTAQVDVPAGYTFSITGASYYGYATLDGGASGRRDSRYYFGSSPVSPPLRHPITGPPNGFFWDQTDTAVAAPASCDEVRQLTIETDPRVLRGTSRNVATVLLHHTDKKFSAAYQLEWHRC